MLIDNHLVYTAETTKQKAIETKTKVANSNFVAEAKEKAATAAQKTKAAAQKASEQTKEFAHKASEQTKEFAHKASEQTKVTALKARDTTVAAVQNAKDHLRKKGKLMKIVLEISMDTEVTYLSGSNYC
jgi:hypothetical protein